MSTPPPALAADSPSVSTWQVCEVDHRQLIKKLLANYDQHFTPLRELLQNADDATATQLDVHIWAEAPHTRTEHATAMGASAAAASPSAPLDPPESCFSAACLSVQLAGYRVRHLLISNNGPAFTCESLNRVRVIAQGNPDANTVGMFGHSLHTTNS